MLRALDEQLYRPTARPANPEKIEEYLNKKMDANLEKIRDARILKELWNYDRIWINGRSYRNISQFVSSRYCFDFGTDANGTPVMTYYGYGHGVGMSQCGAVGFAAEQGMGYREILQHYYTGVSMKSVGSGSSSGGFFGWLRKLFR